MQTPVTNNSHESGPKKTKNFGRKNKNNSDIYHFPNIEIFLALLIFHGNIG